MTAGKSIIDSFTPVSGFIGGTLIGLAAVLLLLANGRIAGVSGILAGVLVRSRGELGWRIAFFAGLWVGAFGYSVARGEMLDVNVAASWPVMVAAGLLVGFGTRMSGGCTSGHGVCGIARLSKRSIVATAVFMATAVVTVFITRHVVA